MPIPSRIAPVFNWVFFMARQVPYEYVNVRRQTKVSSKQMRILNLFSLCLEFSLHLITATWQANQNISYTIGCKM